MVQAEGNDAAGRGEESSGVAPLLTGEGSARTAASWLQLTPPDCGSGRVKLYHLALPPPASPVMGVSVHLYRIY